MLETAIYVLSAVACISGFSFAIWSFATAGKRQEARRQRYKESVHN